MTKQECAAAIKLLTDSWYHCNITAGELQVGIAKLMRDYALVTTGPSARAVCKAKEFALPYGGTTATVTEDKFQALVAAVQCGGLSGELALLTDKPAIAVGLTAQQVRWALPHDWYRSSERSDDGKGQPLYRVWVRGEEAMGEALHLDFTDYQALRAWAGY